MPLWVPLPPLPAAAAACCKLERVPAVWKPCTRLHMPGNQATVSPSKLSPDLCLQPAHTPVPQPPAGLSCFPGMPPSPTLQEWLKDHRLVVATLEELAGQLATLQPQQQAQRSASQPPRRATAGTGSGSGGDGDERKQLLDRLLQRAPSEQLRAYVEGRAPAGRLQRALPEHLDQNMRLLSILAAEMRVLVQRLEQLADAAAAPAAVQGSSAASDGADAGAAGTAAGSPGDGKAAAAGQDPGRPPAAAHVANAEEALLLAAVADGAAKETLLIVSVQRWCGVAVRGSVRASWQCSAVAVASSSTTQPLERAC